MGQYIFIFHLDDDSAAHRMELHFDDDLDALEAAETLSQDYKVDVWAGERLVAQVKKGNAPSTSETATQVSGGSRGGATKDTPTNGSAQTARWQARRTAAFEGNSDLSRFMAGYFRCTADNGHPRALGRRFVTLAV